MRPEIANRLARQASLGVDKGLRLKLQWEGGFSVTVHSWDAAAAILKQGLQTRKNSLTKASSFRQAFYAERYADGVECMNPDTLRTELCFVTLLQNARRGAPPDPDATTRRRIAAQAKVDRLAAKLAQAKAEVTLLSNNEGNSLSSAQVSPNINHDPQPRPRLTE